MHGSYTYKDWNHEFFFKYLYYIQVKKIFDKYQMGEVE